MNTLTNLYQTFLLEAREADLETLEWVCFFVNEHLLPLLRMINTSDFEPETKLEMSRLVLRFWLSLIPQLKNASWFDESDWTELFEDLEAQILGQNLKHHLSNSNFCIWLKALQSIAEGEPVFPLAPPLVQAKLPTDPARARGLLEFLEEEGTSSRALLGDWGRHSGAKGTKTVRTLCAECFRYFDRTIKGRSGDVCKCCLARTKPERGREAQRAYRERLFSPSQNASF
jgi:hypothetical protein